MDERVAYDVGFREGRKDRGDHLAFKYLKKMS
jgi:hypothetical protein